MNLPLLEQKIMGWIKFFSIIEKYLLVMNAFYSALCKEEGRRSYLWHVSTAKVDWYSNSRSTDSCVCMGNSTLYYIFFFCNKWALCCKCLS